MSDFQPGEIVDITIKGVRVDDENADGTVNIIAEHSDGGPATWHMPPQAAVKRVAPAEWPPQPGDLWKDKHNSVWFAVWGIDAQEVFMVPADPVRGPLRTPRPDVVLAKVGPLTLVHREGQQVDVEAAEDGGPVAYPQPGSEIPDQAGYVVGRCGHRVAGSEFRAGFRTCERCPGEGGDES